MPSKSDKKVMNADIVVIGCGASGAAAAVSATDKGARVIALEKAGSPGGDSLFTFGVFGVESPAQKRLEIGLTRDQAFKEAMDWAHWKTDPILTRTYINRSGETIKWLEGKGNGLYFDDIFPIYLYFDFAIRTFHCIGHEFTGRKINEVLTKSFEAKGGKLFVHCAAKQLLTNTKGEITGVLAQDKDGGEIKINSKSVIIASGGFGGNKKLMKKYHPDYDERMFFSGAHSNTGDGFLMAADIGAETTRTGCMLLSSHTYTPITTRSPASDICRAPQSIWVNIYGDRFAPEWLPDHENAVYRQPQKKLFSLFDERFKNYYRDNKHYNSFRGPIEGEMPWGNLDEALQKGDEKGDIKIANSWDEIAKWMGIKPEKLQATVKEYNSFCENGYDPVFNKDKRYLEPIVKPPFYAVTAYQDYHSAVGNIKINEKWEVINGKNKPIPGLYAVGNTTGGWVADTYPIHLAGYALGYAFTSGRIAAENAANYIR